MLLALVLVAGTVATPAAAASCLPAGGQRITRSTTAKGDFVVLGGGYGHAVGMSQYGAKGAASLGCTATQILSTYYPGTQRTTAIPAGLDNIRVSLIPSGSKGTLASTVDVEAVSAGVPWSLDGVTKTQPSGSLWRIAVTDGAYTVTSGAITIFEAAAGPLRVHLDGRIVRLPVKNKKYSRGLIEFDAGPTGDATFATLKVEGLDNYLYGLAEMPSSWPTAALRAQAIAGRTYALKRREGRASRWDTCRCDVYDSVDDQVYGGHDKEVASPQWVAAVNATTGKTLQYDGKTITAFYYSSSGGAVESSAFVFGGELPYSKALDDSRWERASGNPYSTWVQPLTAAAVGAAFDVGTALAVETPDLRAASGRVGDPARGAGGVIITGTAGTKTVSGPTFRMTMGLRSALFTVKSAIAQRYADLGGTSSYLGAPTGPEVTVAGGRMRPYQNGRIYWSPSTGARVVRGAILTKYLAYGGPTSRLGLPTTDRVDVTDGRTNSFVGGAIYTSKRTGAHVLFGPILTKYRAAGGPDSALRIPKTDVYDVEDGRRADCEGGSIRYDSATGSTTITYN